MSRPPVTLPISTASDGTGAKPAALGPYRDDQYYLEAIAERWIREQGRYQAGVTYKLSQLPTGYAGYAKLRDNSKHVDRYLYGHPNGHFRSMNELYPHFKHLQENGGTVGCPCKLCTGKKPASRHSGSPASTPRGPATRITKPRKQSTGILKRSLDSPPSRNKQVDDEGSEDIYRRMLDKLKEAGEAGFKQNFVDSASPDWRTGHKLVDILLENAQNSPRYEARLGELVLFDRTSMSTEGMAWDSTSQALRKFDLTSREWLDFPKWEAGVVTQIPEEQLSVEDLNQIPPSKKQAITYSGYRVEALTPLSSKEKPITSQHKYCPLHALRPFSFWKDCIRDPSQAHPTITHAMRVANSFCIIGKHLFEGVWPKATVFAKGVFIGPELILVGDVVRLLPSEGKNQVTDIMVISAIRLRFVNLDEANDDDYDGDTYPYHVCLHITGKAYTLDPKRNTTGASPVTPGEDSALPKSVASYGTWYPIHDPANPKSRLEVPFSKVIGKCFEDVAMNSWWSSSKTTVTQFSNGNGKGRPLNLSQGLAAIREGRKVSLENDHRIDKANDKSWFWAETRIEQLDLHEINDRFVGVRDEERDRAQMHTWRQALKILDGKRSSFDAFHEKRKERQEQEQQAVESSAAFGMMGGAVQHDSVEERDMENLHSGGEHGHNGYAADAQAGSVQADDVEGKNAAMETSDDSDVEEMAPPQSNMSQLVINVSSDEDALMAD